ncbi:thioesterase family protein [uncultured Bacteroides sp.]|uniref:acyl-CoA thioesterase n=1 Tax=uncultured Bacteroides sp. TaxID=162156 RepID=UPI002AAC0E2F|nr:thioesterase family protein [uncultured Bacteroides sp.]
MERLKFKHTVPIQLRFNDFDTLGHVNNSVYFSFYDLGKTSYFSEVMPEIVSSKDVGAVIANIQVSFLLPVYPNENVAVQTTVVEIGNKSFKLFQQLIDVDTNEVKCICQTVMVGFDAKTKATKSIPDKWRKAMTDFEGRGDLSKVSEL